MDKRMLGKDLEVSTIGYGCMGMSYAYGTASTKKAAEIKLTQTEVKEMDEMLENIPMSQVFGGSKIKKQGNSRVSLWKEDCI